MSLGVFAGASSMCHDTASKPGAGAASANGGTSGNSGNLVADETASARSLPSLINGIEAPASTQPMATCPAAMSWIDCGVERYGTWVISRPNWFFMYSIERCCATPAPGEE